MFIPRDQILSGAETTRNLLLSGRALSLPRAITCRPAEDAKLGSVHPRRISVGYSVAVEFNAPRGQQLSVLDGCGDVITPDFGLVVDISARIPSTT